MKVQPFFGQRVERLAVEAAEESAIRPERDGAGLRGSAGDGEGRASFGGGAAEPP